MTRTAVTFCLVCLLCGPLRDGAIASAQQPLEPGDPIAAVDGEPVYWGELNLILSRRVKTRHPDELPIELQQATATLLVRRHLAMKSLRQLGGDALDAMIRRQIELFATEARRRGSSLQQQAATSMADENSLAADIAWSTAWRQYLKSKLNDTLLRRYFEQHRDRYGGSRWEVSQIFLNLDTKDPRSVTAAEANLTQLADEMRVSDSPADAFAEAARLHSDSGSATTGGKVGWVGKEGDLPGSVMTAVRATLPGQISPPIRSAAGMHLIYVHRSEAGELSFDDITDQAQLRRDAADALFDALLLRQKNAKVVWFVQSLRPPPAVDLLPQ